eukprot:TRINITY_DN12685_c1_g1_i8.p1 TRINITY_DN12685_c1_g1~~TRINITY_DN12685_c1_g1_i8.p1  ORF type:complete len:202 (+),score=-14.85 TRINITY_DN12685_c1_g1_i8:361-966(+)
MKIMQQYQYLLILHLLQIQNPKISNLISNPTIPCVVKLCKFSKYTITNNKTIIITIISTVVHITVLPYKQDFHLQGNLVYEQKKTKLLQKSIQKKKKKKKEVWVFFLFIDQIALQMELLFARQPCYMNYSTYYCYYYCFVIGDSIFTKFAQFYNTRYCWVRYQIRNLGILYLKQMQNQQILILLHYFHQILLIMDFQDECV